MQRLADEVAAAAYTASSVAGVSLGDVGAVVGSVPSLPAEGESDAPSDDEVLGFADGEGVGVALGVSEGVVLGVLLGVGDCEEEPGVPEEEADGLELGLVDESEGDGDAEPLPVGGGVEDPDDPDDPDDFSGWHCETTGLVLTFAPKAPVIPLVFPLARVAARLDGASAVHTRIPVVVARTTPPAMRLSETGRTGRTRAKHMEDPARTLDCSSTLLVCPGWHSHSRWMILPHWAVLMRSRGGGGPVSLGKIHSTSALGRHSVIGQLPPATT